MTDQKETTHMFSKVTEFYPITDPEELTLPKGDWEIRFAPDRETCRQIKPSVDE